MLQVVRCTGLRTFLNNHWASIPDGSLVAQTGQNGTCVAAILKPRLNELQQLFYDQLNRHILEHKQDEKYRFKVIAHFDVCLAHAAKEEGNAIKRHVR